MAIKEYFDSEQVNYNLYLAHFSPPLNRSQMQYISTTYLPSVNFFPPSPSFYSCAFILSEEYAIFSCGQVMEKKTPQKANCAQLEMQILQGGCYGLHLQILQACSA